MAKITYLATQQSRTGDAQTFEHTIAVPCHGRGIIRFVKTNKPKLTPFRPVGAYRHALSVRCIETKNKMLLTQRSPEATCMFPMPSTGMPNGPDPRLLGGSRVSRGFDGGDVGPEDANGKSDTRQQFVVGIINKLMLYVESPCHRRRWRNAPLAPHVEC